MESTEAHLKNYIDPKGHIVLETFKIPRHPLPDAVVFLPGDEKPFVVAHDYDISSGEWSQGTYFGDLGNAHDYADPDILQDATIRWSKEDVREVLTNYGLEPSEENIRDVLLPKMGSESVEKCMQENGIIAGFGDLNSEVEHFERSSQVKEDELVFTSEEDFEVIDREKGEVCYIGKGGNVVVPPTVEGCVVKALWCNSNNLTTLDVSHAFELRELCCNWNNLTQLDTSHNPKLRELDCSGNNLTTLDLSHNPILLRDGKVWVDFNVQVQKTPQRVTEKPSFAAAKAAAVGARDAGVKDVGTKEQSAAKKHEQER